MLELMLNLIVKSLKFASQYPSFRQKLVKFEACHQSRFTGYVNPSIFNSIPQALQHYSIITYLLIPPPQDPQFILANYPEAVGKGPPEVLFCILL